MQIQSAHETFKDGNKNSQKVQLNSNTLSLVCTVFGCKQLLFVHVNAIKSTSLIESDNQHMHLLNIYECVILNILYVQRHFGRDQFRTSLLLYER